MSLFPSAQLLSRRAHLPFRVQHLWKCGAETMADVQALVIQQRISQPSEFVLEVGL